MTDLLIHPVVRPKIQRFDVPDALFATDNSFGIPTLRADLQAAFCELPVRTWGSCKRNQTMPGTWHFYTDDYRFEQLWNDPSGLLNSQCRAIVEPNFSTSEQMPKAVSLYQIFRKRWLARFWQEFGVRVWVDLNVAPDLYGPNLLGVPFTWRAYMTRGYSDYVHMLLKEFDVARQHRATSLDRNGDDVVFAVYGGGVRVKDECARRDWIWIPETMDLRKGKHTDAEIR